MENICINCKHYLPGEDESADLCGHGAAIKVSGGIRSPVVIEHSHCGTMRLFGCKGGALFVAAT